MDTHDKKVVFSMYSEEEFNTLVSLIQSVLKNSGSSVPNGHVGTDPKYSSPITSFGYFFSTTVRDVLEGNNIIFDQSENVLNLTFIPFTSGVVINLTGIYKISYGVNTIQSISSTIELTQNGITIPGTTIQSTTNIGKISGDTLIAASAGTILQIRALRNKIKLAPELNAYMNILQVG